MIEEKNKNKIFTYLKVGTLLHLTRIDINDAYVKIIPSIYYILVSFMQEILSNLRDFPYDYKFCKFHKSNLFLKSANTKKIKDPKIGVKIGVERRE